ncbi:hypothetical protein AVEN_192735-1 [Araneus ventricosus]|uniref:Uncharacterized protein n=1 Tax=Araneus ventricosus TaxID=182803 RepID=A0A4Y2KQY2_ARAVE|nr:hypothetical protein AVEN_192735-1 [Araneus ventricosus]
MHPYHPLPVTLIPLGFRGPPSRSDFCGDHLALKVSSLRHVSTTVQMDFKRSWNFNVSTTPIQFSSEFRIDGRFWSDVTEFVRCGVIVNVQLHLCIRNVLDEIDP